MLELMSGMPDTVVAVRATGQVSGADYKTVLIPAIEEKFQTCDRIRFLYFIDAEFKKFTTTALWDDARVGLHHLTGFERIAVCSDVSWIRTMVKGIAIAMPATLRLFETGELEAAKTWISE
jgi:hypothetical protein